MKNRSYYPFERNRFFYGKLLTVRDFETEQKYFNDKRRLINRVLHGAGVACGLNVVGTDDHTISIESGLAFDYLGREIVLAEPVTRKLSTIDGFDEIQEKSRCYLYVEYAESLKEPVNAVTSSNDSSGSQFSRTEETCRFYFKAEEPSIESILNHDPNNTHRILYDQKGLTIRLRIPASVRSGQETRIGVFMDKHADLPPVRFQLTGMSDYFRSKEGKQELTYHFAENPDEFEKSYEGFFIARSEQVDGILAQLFNHHLQLDLYIGEEHVSKELPVKASVMITSEDPSSFVTRSYYNRNLQSACDGEELGICLASVELISVNKTHIIRNITQVPFMQYIPQVGLNRTGSGNGGNLQEAPGFSTSVSAKRLNVWEKPVADVNYNSETNHFSFKLGIPSALAYDYATSTGTVEIPLGMSAKMNGRYFSDEISHELGLGNVSINVSVVHKDEGAMLFGNAEIFRKADIGISLYKVETAVLVYPQRGTFKIGVRFLDGEDISSLTIKWFALKPKKDSEAFGNSDEITVKIEPDIINVRPREEIRLKAMVTGAVNKRVKWIVKDDGGGTIDENGIYKAATVKGTYEIVAQSEENPEVTASAYVIVNE